VYNQQSQTLFEQTTNVFVEVYNDEQNLILRKLLFANKGVFENGIVLDEKIPSGTYYFRFYTNYMNNFEEDLSSTYTLNIVNSKQEDFVQYEKEDFSIVNVAVYPESGVFLADVINRVSVKVTDCFGNGLEVKNAKVFDKQNRELATFYTNKYGYGNFEIFATSQEEYTISIDVEGKVFTQKMQSPTNSGSSFMVNSYAFPHKTLITIKSKNIDTSKKYFLIINQNGKSVVNKVNFKEKAEWTFLIDNQILFNGVNTVRLVDENRDQLSERLFFLNKRATKKVSIFQNKNKKNTTDLLGRFQESSAVISASVLPGNSKSANSERNIINSLLINPYTIENSNYTVDYFAEVSKTKSFDIDLFFMHQKSRTNWNYIKYKYLPIEHYSFDTGISLKGKIYQEIEGRKDFTINLFSLEAELNESTGINENNEFEFKNLILSDSTWVHFRMMDRDRKQVPLNTSTRVLDNDKPFKKVFTTSDTNNCHNNKIAESSSKEEFPAFKGAIPLETVDVKAKTKSKHDKLTKNNELGNFLMRGVKAEDTYFKDMMLIDFLRSKRFGTVNVNGGDKIVSTEANYNGYINVYEATITTEMGGILQGNPPSVPVITVDNIEQLNHDYVLSLSMSYIDQIYYDRNLLTGAAASMKNSNSVGVINIYTKIPEGMPIKSQSVAFQIKQGFAKNYDFKNEIYTSSKGLGFDNYGVLEWKANIVMDSNGFFQLSFPLLSQESIDVFTEGVSANGELISERKNIILD